MFNITIRKWSILMLINSTPFPNKANSRYRFRGNKHSTQWKTIPIATLGYCWSIKI
jgi:hypothetical protein